VRGVKHDGVPMRTLNERSTSTYGESWAWLYEHSVDHAVRSPPVGRMAQSYFEVDVGDRRPRDVQILVTLALFYVA